ncbi:MAG: MBL fold metallo-hydrolase [Ruminococcaceae bacterium]|nr:MBL fold metallo-hydrolase [Oscillospiraceae bacterium]
MEKLELYSKQLIPGIYLLDEGHLATGYVVEGEEKVCVIDTMNGFTDIKSFVRGFTDKPIVVVNTHGHPDHIFGNVYFDEALIHERDLALAEMFAKEPAFIEACKNYGFTMPPFKTIKEGDVIDLGGKTLEIYELPGHTPGGIVLLLKEDRILFTGDSINHYLWMMLDGCLPMKDFVSSLERIMFLEDKADRILHGHASDFDDISLMRCILQGAKEIVAGKTEGDGPYEWFGGVAKKHSFPLVEGRKYSPADENIICYN